jgi:hypothetical protein
MRQIALRAKGSFNLLIQPWHLASRWKRVPGHFCRRLGDSLRRLPHFIERPPPIAICFSELGAE